MTLYGWDASDFDWPRGPMDLAAARADGISFFTHKATEATDTKHIHYRDAMYRAQNAGVPFLGAYHVVRTGDINAQVDYFLAYVNAQTPWWSSFPGWFWQADLEKWPYDAVAPALGVAFAAEVEQRTGKRCLLYAPQWAYGDSIGGAAPLWASAYGTNPAGPYREAYPGDASLRWAAYSGRLPAILQYGSRATIGSQPICDINAFRGTIADFAALIGGTDMSLDAADKAFITDSLNRIAAGIIYGDGRDDILAQAGKSETHPWNIEAIFKIVTALKADSAKVLGALDTLKTAVINTPTNADLKLELDDAVATLEAFITARGGTAPTAVTDEQLDASFRRVLASVAASTPTTT